MNESMDRVLVDWLREGERYQVHLDVLVGPSFAPIVQRRMSSDGTITAEGLTPRRYDEQTDLFLSSLLIFRIWSLASFFHDSR